MPRFQWVGLTVLAVACGGRSYIFDPTPTGDAGSSGDDAGSSSNGGSNGGSTSSGGIIGSSTGSGSSGGSGGSDSSSGSTTGSSGSGSIGEDGSTPSCNAPASSVPSSEVLPYLPVVQMKGACTPSDIAGFITACDSAGSTNPSCNNWFNSASSTCVSCLASADAGISRTGGLDSDYQGNFLGANLAGCVAIVDGNSTCASAYEEAVQCLAAAGCLTCMDQASANSCENTIFSNGGACYQYIVTYQSACMADMADGGSVNGGPCTNDTGVLSVICGNGSGDGG